MSYCVHCGVELAPSERDCPLCGTAVLNPRRLGGLGRTPAQGLLDASLDWHLVLSPRLRARVRRLDPHTNEALTIGDLSIDVAGHQVTRAGAPIGLTPLEFDLLLCLARKPWQVFTREVLNDDARVRAFKTLISIREVLPFDPARRGLV